jgi:hypothetical protein
MHVNIWRAKVNEEKDYKKICCIQPHDLQLHANMWICFCNYTWILIFLGCYLQLGCNQCLLHLPIGWFFIIFSLLYMCQIYTISVLYMHHIYTMYDATFTWYTCVWQSIYTYRTNNQNMITIVTQRTMIYFLFTSIMVRCVWA